MSFYSAKLAQHTHDDNPQVVCNAYHFRVSYIDSFASGSYRVFRSFKTRAAAQEFIDNNALVWPLRGVELEEVEEWKHVPSGD